MSITTGIFLATTPTTVFTSSGISSVTTMWFHNHSDTETITVSIYVVKNGETVGDANKIAEFQIVPKDSFYTNMERFVLDDGDSIVAQASLDNAVSCVVSYLTKEV